MKGIGGNTKAIIQITDGVTKNVIGEDVQNWIDVQSIKGWLDLQGGDARYTSYYAKIQEATHVFVADYVELDPRITEENSRLVIKGKRYDVKCIDNPMGMGKGSQLEIYLRYTGGQ